MSAQIIQFPSKKRRSGKRAPCTRIPPAVHQYIDEDELKKRLHRFWLKRGIIQETSH